MSDVTATLVKKTDWVEELQRKVFDECVARARSLPDQIDDDDDDGGGGKESSATTLTSPSISDDVSVSIIVSNIDQNFAQIPHFRQRSEFLEELRKSLQKVSRNKRVDWLEFKESSEHWFLKLFNLLQQDGNNNNVRLNHCDAPTEDSERDGFSMEEHSDAIDDEFNSCSINQLDTVASCYSLNSSSMGFGTTDSMMESSEETDHQNDDISGIDLKVRIRRFNEETANLRDDLSRAEDTISSLERDIKSTKSALERINGKYTRLQKENEDQREMLADVTQREESYKQDLWKVEKAYSNLEKKIAELEQEKENVLNLKARIETLTKENSMLIKQLADYRKKYDEKMVECSELQEENEELQKKLLQLEKSYEKNVEHLQEKIQELQDMNTEFQLKMMNKSDSSSSTFSLTPPPYNYINTHIHSTPYNKSNKIRHQDSLYSELKASGYNTDDVNVEELKNELSFYNDEIAVMSQQLDDALQEIAAARNEITVPNVQLVEPEGIQTLKRKIMSLLELVKSSCTAMKAARVPAVAPRMGEDSREKKPDVLPESTKTNYLSDDQLFGSEKLESDLVGSVTTSLTTTADNKQFGKVDRSSSILPEGAAFITETSVEESTPKQEVIVPIHEALSRIIEIKGVEEELIKPHNKPSRKPKQRSIFTLKKPMDYMNLAVEDSNISTSQKIKSEYEISKAHVSACGDGPHHDFVKPEQSSDVESPKPILDFKNEGYVASPGINEIDTRYVTVRPSRNETYLALKSEVLNVDDKSSKISEVSDPLKPLEMTYFPLHSPQAIPRRKLSVYQRSFDIDNLQKPDSTPNTSSEKRRSVSTPDVQEFDYSGFRSSKSANSFDMSVTKNELLTTYRSTNNSDSSCSLSPAKDVPVVIGTDEESPFRHSEVSKKKPLATRLRKPVILAPKLKLPESVNHTYMINQEEKKASKPLVSCTVPKAVTQKNSSFEKISSKDVAEHSKILSSSSNLVRKEEIKIKKEPTTTTVSNFTADSYNIDNSNTGVSPNIILRNDKTYALNDEAIAEMKKTTAVANSAPSAAAVREESISPRSCSGASSGIDSSSSRVPAVVRAMSSGEDSSAESECNALQALKKSSVATTADKTPVESVKVEESVEKPKTQSLQPSAPAMLDCSVVAVDSSGKPVLSRRRSNSCTETVTSRDVKPVVPIVVNGIEKNNSCQKVVSNVLPREAIKEDDSPKAFPNLSDERLQESGIASFPDIDTEISENLSEEESKKKYTAFSVGLATDRMTLSKRMILSRRHRDQAEKNFNNEVLKMEQDIKELAPLCVDSESLERVERAKLQLEMVVRCNHRISSSAETLGAVHQERRVSRAVMLADKYLQTLRAKCEKLANELAETKRILAENNIVLEENLSEMGDDVPRVRYRAVPNNNRTMMARRRASIATISRPLMGSNQDITKEPRQRNSVSGRVPGLRRPSLCYETPKWEIEKLDRTDSASSIAELRDIFEQAESRRHSREENNNLIQTSINNMSIITSEHTEEEEVWSNTREDIALESANGNLINSLELRENNGHPLIICILNRYRIWKPMIWGLFVAFLLGIFLARVVSSNRRNGPPISWWSIEEILNQYMQVENENFPVPRPI